MDPMMTKDACTRRGIVSISHVPRSLWPSQLAAVRPQLDWFGSPLALLLGDSLLIVHLARAGSGSGSDSDPDILLMYLLSSFKELVFGVISFSCLDPLCSPR